MFKGLEDSLEKYGQIEAIHKCRFGIIDGYKRSTLLVGSGSKTVDHPEVETLTQYKELLLDSQPIYLKPREKKQYAIIRATEFKKAGFSNEDIRDILLKLLRVGKRQLQRYLPEEYRVHDYPQIGKMSDSKQLLMSSNLKTDFGFLDEREFDLLLKAYDRCGKEKFLDVLCRIKEHFSAKKSLVELTPIEMEKLKAELLKDHNFLLEAKSVYEERMEDG